MRHKDKNRLIVGLLLVLLGGLPARAQLTEADVLSDLTAMALERNLGASERASDVEANRAAFDASRLAWRPTLSLDARFTRAGGGRTIDLPLGDLLNPVYQSLGSLTGQPGAFPVLDNQSIGFLREQEQETRVRLVQPVYQPRLTAAIRARRAAAEVSELGFDAYRAELTRDVAVAYYTLRQAEQNVAVLAAARELVDENLRVAERRQDAGDALPADVLRARAETFAVAGEQAGATRDLDLARSFLNTLLDRPLGTRIPTAQPDVSTQADDASLEVQQAQAAARRAELDQLDAAVRASQASVALAQADLRPSVAVALDAGVQGRGYVPDDDGPFYLASVVASWTLWRGGAARAEVRQARARLDAARTRRQSAEQQIRLQVRQADDAVRAGRVQINAAEQRLTAAREAFRLTNRLVAEGAATQVQFLDARTALTQAELGLAAARYDLLIQRARLDFAAGTFSPDR